MTKEDFIQMCHTINNKNKLLFVISSGDTKINVYQFDSEQYMLSVIHLPIINKTQHKFECQQYIKLFNEDQAICFRRGKNNDKIFSILS